MREVGLKYGYDFSKLIVVASNDINEEAIVEMNSKCHEIDVFGIGTNLVTCQSQPALGMVYKLVENNGVPKIKLSEDKIKVLIPGRKKVFRIYEGQYPTFDILLNEEEKDLAEGSIEAFDPYSEEKFLVTADKVEKLTVTIFENGKDVYGTHSCMQK